MAVQMIKKVQKLLQALDSSTDWHLGREWE